MNILVILSGGKGERFGGTVPKQYQKLNGKEIIAYAIEAANKSKLTDAVVIAANSEYTDYLKKQYHIHVTGGGDTHNKTVKNALDFTAEHFPDCEKIVFLDSVRPFVTAELIDEYFTLLDEYDSVITAQKITDSLGKRGVPFTDRKDYFLIQKPEAFRFKPLYSCFNAESECTAIVQQMPPESRRMEYCNFRSNMKITYPEDLFIAKQLIKKGCE
jgi:2-C-methyl-D-erythritol 4-phosphate cytidylyltransferase